MSKSKVLIFKSSETSIEEMQNTLNNDLGIIGRSYDITKIDAKVVFKFLWYSIIQYEIVFKERMSSTEHELIKFAYCNQSIVKIVNGKNMSRSRFKHEVDKIKLAIERAQIPVESSSNVVNANENFFNVMFSNEYAEKFDIAYASIIDFNEALKNPVEN